MCFQKVQLYAFCVNTPFFHIEIKKLESKDNPGDLQTSIPEGSPQPMPVSHEGWNLTLLTASSKESTFVLKQSVTRNTSRDFEFSRIYPFMPK